MLHLLPNADSIDFDVKFANHGVVMTDTCNGAKKTNRLLGEKISFATGNIIHSLLCFNHLRNVWVKNVLEASTVYLRDHLHDSLDDMATELRINPSFLTLARAFDKEFSLCANYPKGHGDLFCQWMKKNHPGELLLHVERAASGGRQDVVSMASLAIFWNRNYCIEFLDEILIDKKKGENILARNLFVMLSSLEMVAVARLWSIFHFSLIMPIRWLSGKCHKLGKYGWCYINLARVLDTLKISLESIVDSPKLIHDEQFMMGLMTPWAKQLPPFKEYLNHMFKKKTMRYVVSEKVTGARAVPLQDLRHELFNPVDEDNKNCTQMLENIAKIAAQAWIDELMDPKKGTYQYMSESESPYCWSQCTDELKLALRGQMAVNDQAESSFAGVTAQISSYGRIDLSSAAAVSDVNRNRFLFRPTTQQDIKNDKRGMFHSFPEELQIAAVTAAMEWSAATKENNNIALERQRDAKRTKEEMAKKKFMASAHDRYDKSRMYYWMWYNSEQCWKTEEDVTLGLAMLTYKKDMEKALRENILIRYDGFGWKDCRTLWTRDGKKKKVEELAARLVEIIQMTSDRPIPDKLVLQENIPKRRDLPILGQLTAKVKYLYAKSESEFVEREDDIELVDGRVERVGELKLEIGKRIEYLAEFSDDLEYDNDEEDEVEPILHWCGGVIEQVCDGGDAAWVLWDNIPQYNYEASKSLEAFEVEDFEGDCAGAWRWSKDLAPTKE